MKNRRERTLQDLCDVTPTLSQPQITPVLRGNFRMQKPSPQANCDSLTNMVTSENNSYCSGRSQKVFYSGNSGTCNVCAAPCSSCFHVNKVLLESNNESAGETSSSILSPVGGMETSDSFSENAAAKASSKIKNVSASDDSVLHSKCDGRVSPEGHDDCLSCVSGTDQQVNRKSDTEDSGNKCNKQSKFCEEVPGKVSPSSSQTEISFTKSTDVVTDIQKVQNTSQASNYENPHVESPMNSNNDKPSDTIVEVLKGSTEHFNSSSPNGVASDDVCGDPSKTDLNSIEKNDDMEVEIHPADESDDSDMVEQDVKVCDICGDAGREDLLAICSRCSDGAEHTYCMRETLEKVPEGEWFCEECAELVGNGKEEKVGSMDETEKNNSSGRASENLINSDVEGHRTKGSTKTSKRLRDDEDAEVSSIAKKPALESFVGSPKMSNSKIALSRESSLKNLDKGRLQSPSNSTLDTIAVNDATELEKPASDARGLNLRGTFAKSNSFNSLNSKPKVKLVDQVVIQRQKSAKEGVDRSIGKSMSFRSTNSNNSESKTKMLSPRSSHIQDFRSTKERNAFERQRSFRTEHRANNSIIGTSMSPTSRSDKRPSSRVESSSLTMPTNHHEVKQVQIDGKSTLSRSSSLAARRTADASSSTGEFKRPSKLCRTTPVASSVNGVNNNEQKYNQTSLKQDPASCPSGDLPDGLIQSKDIADSANQPREYSGSRLGPPSARSSRDESDNLRAAIEAAQLRKPGVYRKHKYFGQPDESSVPFVTPVTSHIDHVLSARNRKLSSDIDLAASRNLTADPLKEETLNSVKQSLLLPAVIPLQLETVAIPKQEYTWQGSFEICRSGQTFELWGGIQAHLSTCASPKVVEAVNKFKNTIVLHEVSRASNWPVQFQENGVREDNIALFFFAKDSESHEKIYKVLLDNMMKNDLALKGSINGVEILIFPSNQLPVNLQRWNMLFYLWGVFRGKKESSVRQMPAPVITPRDIPLPIMSLPGNRCSLRPIPEHASQDVVSGLEVPASEELHNLTRVVKRDFDIDVSPLDQLRDGPSSSLSSAVQSNVAKQCGEMRGAHQVGDISASCSPSVATTIPGSGREQRVMQPDTALGNPHSAHDSHKSVDGMPNESTGEGATTEKTRHQNQLNSTTDVIDLSTDGEEVPSEDDTSIKDLNVEPDRWLSNRKLREPSSLGGMPKEGTGEGATTDKTCHQNQLNSRTNVIDLSTDGEVPLEDDISIKDLNVEPNKWLFSQEEPMIPGPSSLAHPTLCAGTSRVSPINVDMHNETHTTLEKVQHLPTISYALPNLHGEASVGTFSDHHEHAERYFFPVQSQPWKTHLLHEDRLNDRAPNLELALGAETPPLTLGIEPLMVSKVDQKAQEYRILEEARKKAEKDVSASLSLSLSFPFPEKEIDVNSASVTEQLISQRKHPFPEKEVDAKPPSSITEQLVSQRKHVNTSSRLLFGNLRDN